MTRLLIVDDQSSFRRNLKKLLTQAGLRVVGEADNIPKAVELTRKLKPDIAVVDVMLPGESGLEGISRLKALAPEMRVILVSAYKGFDRSAKEAGAESFVSKDDLDLQLVKQWTKRR